MLAFIFLALIVTTWFASHVNDGDRNSSIAQFPYTLDNTDRESLIALWWMGNLNSYDGYQIVTRADIEDTSKLEHLVREA